MKNELEREALAKAMGTSVDVMRVIYNKVQKGEELPESESS